MREPFKFSRNAQADLRRTLRRRKYPTEAIDAFIAGAEYDVDEWLFLWPPIPPGALGEGRDRLAKIESHLEKLMYEVANLPIGWRQALWTEVEWQVTPAGAERRTHVTLQDAHTFLRALHGVVFERIDACFLANGRNNARKRPLVRHLAMRFDEVLGKRPSATPGGPFMSVIDLVSHEIDLRIGKDIVRATLEEWRASV